jgi:hypothetical protein
MQIFSLLADTLAEIQEQVVGDEDDCEEVAILLLTLKILNWTVFFFVNIGCQYRIVTGKRFRMVILVFHMI